MNAECRTEVPVNKLISYLVFKSNVNFFFEHSKMYVYVAQGTTYPINPADAAMLPSDLSLSCAMVVMNCTM